MPKDILDRFNRSRAELGLREVVVILESNLLSKS
jgi:hypothetical protein